MDVVFVTGNPNKARLFSKLVGMEIEHKKAHTEEIQDLDLVKVAEHKAIQAFSEIKRPVIIEDAGVSIEAFGRLPGPFIKWFVDEIGLEAICRLADKDPNRLATASDVFVYYDGKDLKHFVGSLEGKISHHPLGEGGWDWDKIFIPYDNKLTMGQMSEEEYHRNHLRIKPMAGVKAFLSQVDTE